MPFLRLASRRLVPVFFCLPLVAALASARVARAQTASDADRAAARELFVEGVKLQEAGSFADALDRFDRAQAVFSAPTHLLHIAECEAAIGKLVESAEMYRTLVRTPLPAGAPNAFVQAQQQGAAELTQVEPRIPSIRISVKPANIQNLSIQIDGQAMSPALVGVQRPTDPGTHVVIAYAPGYMRSEQRVVLREKENKDVSVNLPLANGITYQPGPATAPPPPPQNNAPAPPPPPMYGTAKDENEPAKPKPANGGFMLGVTAGALIPAGNLQQGSAVSSVAGGGPGVGIEGGFRFVKRLYLGLAFEHGFLTNGSASSSASSNYIGLDFAYISNPDGVAFFGELGAGYRVLSTFDSSTTGVETSTTFTGGEVSLGVGVHIKLGDWVRLVPKASISAGQFNTTSGSSTTAPLTGSSTTGNIANADTHSFVLIGVTAYFDFARKH